MNRQLGSIGAAAILAILVAACASGTSPSPSPSNAPTASARPSASPEPTDEPTPAPSAEDSAAPSSSSDPSGFTIEPHPDADTLFIDRDDCENVPDGYRVEFPEAWFTNTEIGDAGPCSWFAPTTFEADDSSEVPAEIVITIELVDGDSGSFGEVISRETGIVGRTQEATRVEWENSGERSYVFQIQLGPSPEEGPNIVAMTTTEMGGDYELNKAILDRIIATMELLGTIE